MLAMPAFRAGNSSRRAMPEQEKWPLASGVVQRQHGRFAQLHAVAGAGDAESAVRQRFGVRGAVKAAAPPADLGARVSRYRCCLPALAGFST